ncbi:AP-3 complex subunit sigma-like [Schistocerca americana]|uniref:AP-3 complex subunit sigma-like n=1 Tax=Schistocerca americana TaxID=7009 RepID=UPI001F501EC5|nr:AP-3 complex subunit sigma-like [Schistocerca americana]
MGDGQRLVLQARLIARVQERCRHNMSEIFDCADLLGTDSRGAFRRLDTLVVLFGIDGGESPLYILDLIDAFIHALRAHFGTPDQLVERAFALRLDEVSHLLDEMVQGGLVLEAEPDEAVAHLRAQLDSDPARGRSSSVSCFLSGLATKLRK